MSGSMKNSVVSDSCGIFFSNVELLVLEWHSLSQTLMALICCIIIVTKNFCCAWLHYLWFSCGSAQAVKSKRPVGATTGSGDGDLNLAL